jgi:sugar phosphate isomerase/epimerase
LALGHDPVAVVRAQPVAPAMVQAKDVERARDAVPVGPGWVRYGPQPAVRFRAAGWGEVDWRRLLTALAEREYAGDLLIEHEDLLSSPEDGLAAAAGFLRPLAATVSVGNRRTW